MAAIETKICTMCKVCKPISEYRTRGGLQKHLIKSRCNTCLFKEHRKWAEANQDRIKEYREKDEWSLVKRCARYGISPEQLVEAYEGQEEKCEICRKHIELSDSAIDHNHHTGMFRGVLCKKCNRALGMLGDSITTLTSAVKYLQTRGSYGDGA